MLSSNTSAVSGDTTYVEDVFSTYLYNGNDTSQTITNGVDLSTKGGMVWVKRRSSAGNNGIVDTARGRAYMLFTNTTDAQVGPSGSTQDVTSFNTDGFSIGTNGSLALNTAGSTYASWSFRKQPKFFDVVTYTGTGSAQNVAHSLGSVPACIIVKRTDTTADWSVYHVSTGNGYATALNSNLRPVGPIAGFWNSTTPTSTEFTVGNHSTTNASGGTYVAYILASNAGGFGLTGTDNVITCSSFTTDGSGNATVNLGYEPQWVLIRNITRNTVDWHIDDNMRGMPTSGQSRDLKPNLSDAETGNPLPNPTATGFKVTGVADFGGADTYIYIAIRRGPMKVPTDATKVFAADLGSSSGTLTYDANFVVDFAIDKSRTVSPSSARASDRLRGANTLTTPTTDAESASNQLWDSNTTFRFNSTGDFSTRIAWLFRRAPSFFDEVCYKGTGVATTISHSLGVAPQFLLVKRRATSSSNWQCWHVGLPSVNGRVHLNLNVAQQTGGGQYVFGDDVTGIPPTSSVFYVGSEAEVNGSGDTFVAYLFATCAGVSKVGSYTGTGTTLQVDCGFAAGARFVLIKRTDSTGDWYVWDTARGIVSGNDPYLLLNSTAAEVTSTDYIDTYSAGFELSSTAPAAINASGGTFIFLAIA